MVPLVALVLIVPLLSATAVMSAVSASLPLLSKSRAHRLHEAGRAGARSLEKLHDRTSRVLTCAALTAGFTYAATAGLVAVSLLSTYDSMRVWIALLAGLGVSAILVFTLGEALPRSVAVQNPEGVALAAARTALPLTRLVYPVARALAAPWRAAMGLVLGERAALSPWITEDEYRASAPVPEEEAAREETEERILDAVSDFTGKVVREVMVPRTDMTCLPDTGGVDEALEAIGSAGYSRLPVYHETVDDIRGVLYAKDLLLRVGRGETDVSPASIAREAYFVPETKPVEELLLEMRERMHIAVVVDEHGGTAGLVTIEDLIEEIVGEIFDEYDRQVPMIVEVGDGRLRVDARLPVDDLNEAFGTAIDTEADTVGGLFAELAGRIPAAGEELEIEGLRLVVEELEGTRVRHLLVGPLGNGPEEA